MKEQVLFNELFRSQNILIYSLVWCLISLQGLNCWFLRVYLNSKLFTMDVKFHNDKVLNFACFAGLTFVKMEKIVLRKSFL